MAKNVVRPSFICYNNNDNNNNGNDYNNMHSEHSVAKLEEKCECERADDEEQGR